MFFYYLKYNFKLHCFKKIFTYVLKYIIIHFVFKIYKYIFFAVCFKIILQNIYNLFSVKIN